MIFNDIHHLSISFNFLLIFGKRCWKLPVIPKGSIFESGVAPENCLTQGLRFEH